ncbi:hypothetical protein [Ensifer sp. LC54]|uniref:hypothetical protein n=1 Tax=unclassified Ensifer TaxID=2633371 RepID=UPI000A8788CA
MGQRRQKRVQGLVNRRSAEAGLWAKGAFFPTNAQLAAAKAPDVVTKENVSWLAGIIVASFAGGAFLFIRKRLDPA